MVFGTRSKRLLPESGADEEMRNNTDMDKEYVFLSLMIPQDLAENVRANAVNQMAEAANVLEHNLMRGFTKNLSIAPKVMNILPIGSYPQYYKKPFIGKSKFRMCGRDDNENLAFCNIKVIRNYSIERTVYRRLNSYCKKKGGEIVLCIYSDCLGFLKAAAKIKKKYPKVLVCNVIADLPGMSNLSEKKSFLLKWYIARKAAGAMRYLAHVDCFALLTEQMADYLHIQKPYCIVEGIATETALLRQEKQNNNKIILYAGTLHRRFGILNLVEAFGLIDDLDYRLVICGAGDSEKEIRMVAKEDSRIIFLGQLPREKVLEWQKKATVLVNPRPNNEEYTKYSFPSKIMEYLSSGIPVVAYKLDGIPDEYDKFIQYVNGDSVECLKEKLMEICELSASRYEEIGNAGREFVLEKKNCIIQTAKIIKMIKLLESG